MAWDSPLSIISPRYHPHINTHTQTFTVNLLASITGWLHFSFSQLVPVRGQHYNLIFHHLASLCESNVYLCVQLCVCACECACVCAYVSVCEQVVVSLLIV